MAYFMMRQNSYIVLKEAELNVMMTKACGATNCTVIEVGGVTSGMMVRGATKIIQGII